MTNNSKELQPIVFPRRSNVRFPVLSQKKYDFGYFADITIDFDGAQLGNDIRYQKVVKTDSVLTLTIAETLVRDLLEQYELVNPYGFFGLRCEFSLSFQPNDEIGSLEGSSLGLAAFVAILSALMGRQPDIKDVFAGVLDKDGNIRAFSDEETRAAYILECKLKVLANRSDTINRVILSRAYESQLAGREDNFSFKLVLVSNVNEVLPILFGEHYEDRLKEGAHQLKEWLMGEVARREGMETLRYQPLFGIQIAATLEERKSLLEAFHAKQEITLEAIHYDLTVKRKTQDWCLEKLLCESVSSPLLLVFADNYQGKTTLLRGLQYELLQRKKCVFWNRSRKAFNWSGIDNLARKLRERIYVLVDDIDQCADWPDFLKDISVLTSGAVIVGTCGSAYQGDEIVSQLFPRPVTTRLYLRDDEPAIFLSKLQENEIVDRTFDIGKKRYGDQLSELLEVVLSKRLDTYITRQAKNVERLEPKIRDGVLLTSSLAVFGVWMPVRLLRRFDYSPFDILDKAQEVIRPIRSEDGGPLEYLGLSSRRIAARILDDYEKRGDWNLTDSLIKIAHCIEATEVRTAINLCLALAQDEFFRKILLSADFETVIELIRKERLSSIPYIYSHLALSYYRKGDWKSAREIFLKACVRSAKNNFPYYKAADCYVKEGRFHGAVLYYIKSAIVENTSLGYGTVLKRIRELQRCSLTPRLQERLVSVRVALAKRAVKVEPTVARNHSDLGAAYKSAKKLEEAIHEFKESVRLDSADDFPCYRIAECYENLGNLPSMTDWGLKGAQIEFENKKTLRGYTWLVDKLSTQKNSSALDTLCSAISGLGATAVSNRTNSFEFGSILLKAGHYHEALEHLQRAKELILQERSDSETKRSLAFTMQKIGQCHESLGQLEEMMAAYKEDAQLQDTAKAFGVYGRKAADYKFFRGADYFFSESVRRNPNYAPNLSQLAEIKMELQDYKGALEASLRALDSRFDVGDQKRVKQCCQILGIEEDITMPKNKSEQIPNHIRVAQGKSFNLEKVGTRRPKRKWWDHLEIIDEDLVARACEEDRKVADFFNNPKNWVWHGQKLFRLNQDDTEIKAAFERARAIDPSNFDTLREYGYVALRLKDYDLTISLLTDAIQMGSKRSVNALHLAKAYVNRGEANKHLGKSADADNDFSQAIETVNDDEAWQEIAKALERASANSHALIALEKISVDVSTNIAAASDEIRESQSDFSKETGTVSPPETETTDQRAVAQCPSSKLRFPEGTKFCTDCGRRLINECSQCRSKYHAETNFCGICGIAPIRIE